MQNWVGVPLCRRRSLSSGGAPARILKLPAQRRVAQVGIAAGELARTQVPQFSSAPTSAKMLLNIIKYYSTLHLMTLHNFNFIYIVCNF